MLISAMNQKDASIFKKTNIQSDALMINQCDDENYWEEHNEFGTIKIFSTKERGLSNSRNMAIKEASKKYVLLCDDDEILYNDYSKTIEKSFEENPKADIICFQIKREGKKYSNKGFKLGFFSTGKIGSWQICIKLESIKKTSLKFDSRFGAGTSVGSGEESIFLHDCLREGLSLYYVPHCIGEVAQKKSTWFKGFDELYFLNRGKIVKRSDGFFWGLIYCFYFVLVKYKRYRRETSFFCATKNILKGFFVE